MPGIDEYVKLLLTMDGANGSTTFTDYSATPKTVTPNGNAQISTAQSKFGAASGLFDGIGDYLTIPDSDDWCFGSGDFTIDLWFRLAVDGGSHTFFSIVPDSYNQLLFFLYHTANPTVYSLWFMEKASNSTTINYSATVTIIKDTWYHLALVKSGTGLRFYIDGVYVGNQATFSGSFANFTTQAYIGTFGGSFYFTNGYYDEIRISKGIARWTANFTPPTSAYGYSVVAPSGSTHVNATQTTAHGLLLPPAVMELAPAIQDILRVIVVGCDSGQILVAINAPNIGIESVVSPVEIAICPDITGAICHVSPGPGETVLAAAIQDIWRLSRTVSVTAQVLIDPLLSDIVVGVTGPAAMDTDATVHITISKSGTIGMINMLGTANARRFDARTASVTYRCVLTGSEDGLPDIVIPISNFQVRKRALV